MSLFGKFGKQPEANDDTVLHSVNAPVEKALIMICEKCGTKVSKGDDNYSRTLQKQIKKTILEKGKRGEMRAVVTSCLDVCPNGKVVAAIVHVGDLPSTEFVEFDPAISNEVLVENLMDAAKK